MGDDAVLPPFVIGDEVLVTLDVVVVEYRAAAPAAAPLFLFSSELNKALKAVDDEFCCD